MPGCESAPPCTPSAGTHVSRFPHTPQSKEIKRCQTENCMWTHRKAAKMSSLKKRGLGSIFLNLAMILAIVLTSLDAKLITYTVCEAVVASPHPYIISVRTDPRHSRELLRRRQTLLDSCSLRFSHRFKSSWNLQLICVCTVLKCNVQRLAKLVFKILGTEVEQHGEIKPNQVRKWRGWSMDAGGTRRCWNAFFWYYI